MRARFLLAVLVSLSPALLAQGTQPSSSPSQEKERTGLARWLDIQTGTIAMRYRWIETDTGLTVANQVQHQEVLKARLLFDPKAKYTLNLGMASGSSFTGSWNTTGWGTGDLVTNIYTKQLFLSAKPFTGMEVQYGGLGVVRGESSEITTYDNDAYIVGERLSIKRPKELFLDEISVTYAYLGDILTPSLNKRFHRLQQSNYHQFLVAKSIGKRAGVSVDYTSQWGIETLREAVRVKIPESRVLSSFRYENYQRLDVNEDFGFAVQGDRQISKRLNVSAGYADIDPNYGGLNADRFSRGRRVYLLGSFALARRLTLGSFYQHAVANDFPIPNQVRFEVVLTYAVF